MIYESIQTELAQWERYVERRFGGTARLVSVSRADANRRVYRIGDRFAKVQKVGPQFFRRANDLAGEHRILVKLAGIGGVCRNAEYHREEGWECLSYDGAAGESLENLLISGRLALSARLLADLLAVIVRVNHRGVCHRDLKAENVVIGPGGEVHLIDFDQAIEVPPLTALLVDVFGIGKPRQLGFFCFEDLVRGYRGQAPVWLRPASTGLRLLRRSSRSWRRYHPARAAAAGDRPEVLMLQKAWEIARQSGASFPGGGVAYYSLDVAGCHLDGERPWTLRWSEVFKKVSFQGKTVLECGCNLGLFSAFARRAGAVRCLGVDVNRDILAGSRLVSQALGVENEFRRVDFDADEPWEEELAGHDLVIALSVLHWLKNWERFLAFLGRHREILYEGHDSVEQESARLRRAGFDKIDVLVVSERGRAVIHASK